MKKLLLIITLLFTACSTQDKAPQYSDEVERCVSRIKAQLKDPESFKMRGEPGFHDSGEIVIYYSATNSFGGRVSDMYFCYGIN